MSTTKTTLISSFLFLGLIQGYSQMTNIALPKSFSKKLKGTISKSHVTVDLTKKDSVLSGSYYYFGIGDNLELDGKINNKGNFTLTEKERTAGNQTGTFTGHFTDTSTITGTWTNQANTKSFPFKLTQTTEGFATIIDKSGSEKFCISDSLKDSIAPWSNNPCSTTDVSAFQVALADKTVEQNVNDFIKGAMLSTQNDDEKRFMDTVSFDQCFNTILYSFDGDTGGIGSELSVGYGIVTNDNDILSFYISEWSYGAGAAHGAGGETYYNIDLTTGQQIGLGSLFIDDYADTLNYIARKLFNEQNDSVGHNFQQMTDNFYITPGGIGCHFNVYEIGPYMAGPADVDIPYKDIDFLIDSNSVLTRFWHKHSPKK